MTSETGTVSTLDVSRVINAPRERVFEAWTNPGQLKAWFGPGTCSAKDVSIDLRIGGAYSIKVTDEDHGECEVVGTYKEITAPERLVFSWRWLHESEGIPASTVTVDFMDQDGATEVRIRHEGLASAEGAEEHRKGWTGCLVCLEEHLS